MENKILYACILMRSVYEQLKATNTEKLLGNIGKIIFDGIHEYYTKDPEADHCDIEILTKRFTAAYPRHANILDTFLKQCPTEVSIPNVVAEIEEFRVTCLKEELQAALESNAHKDSVVKLAEEYINTTKGTTETTEIIGKTVEQVITKTGTNNKIRLLPKALDEAAGNGVLRGHHLLIFARPDTGKTAFALTLINGFLKQNLTVLYVGNEDPMDDILLRLMTNITSMSRDEIQANPEKAHELLTKRRYYTNLICVEMYPGTITDIEDKIKQYKPDVLLVDQARNISTKENNRVQELEYVERKIRNLGKKYNLVTVSFTQAGDSGTNKLVLDMGDVDNSNTGMQASADLMVGIGVNAQYEKDCKRMLSFPKNKLGYNKEPKLVTLNPKYSRFE